MISSLRIPKKMKRSLWGKNLMHRINHWWQSDCIEKMRDEDDPLMTWKYGISSGRRRVLRKFNLFYLLCKFKARGDIDVIELPSTAAAGSMKKNTWDMHRNKVCLCMKKYATSCEEEFKRSLSVSSPDVVSSNTQEIECVRGGGDGKRGWNIHERMTFSQSCRIWHRRRKMCITIIHEMRWGWKTRWKHSFEKKKSSRICIANQQEYIFYEISFQSSFFYLCIWRYLVSPSPLPLSFPDKTEFIRMNSIPGKNSEIFLSIGFSDEYIAWYDATQVAVCETYKM